MNLRNFTIIGSLTAFAAGGALLAPPLARAAEQGVEELTRGPVHEAFAASVSFDPEPGMFVKVAPPALIEEVAPDQRPEGDNVAWIPGYWGWDDEQNDFIWISGVWRNLPPGRQWVPGYWGEVGSQWQWTSGYWADEEAEEVTYVSKPPRSIESGLHIAAPSHNHIWVSGSWIYRDDRYAWRPGYWQAGYANWMWTPANYLWTPRGYVFVDGYWDYNVDHRGVVFAPVHFQHEYYSRPNYYYTPLVAISLAVFTDHLFVRPHYGHYYYGDYYAPRYHGEGFYASFSYSSGYRGYDPIYMHNRWQHRDNVNWERSRRENYQFYQTHEEARPPRTWAALQSRPEAARRGQRDNYQLAEPLQQYASRSKSQRFQTVSAENRNAIVEKNKQVRKFSQERSQLENRPNDQATEGADKRVQVKREKFEKSPVAGKRTGQLSGKDAPPKRPEPKITGAEGKGVGTADEPKNTGRPNKDGSQPESGKAKERDSDQPRDKNAGPAVKPDGRPDQKGDPKAKEKGQDSTRPERSPDGDKPKKADTNPTRATNEPEQPKKQAAQPENSPKKEREPQAEPQPKHQAEPQPKHQAEPQPKHQAEPQPKHQAEPQPKHQAEPQPKHQAEPQPKHQAEPQPKHQAEPQPKHQAEPQPKHQAEPQPKHQAEPQQPHQTKTGHEPAAGKEPAANKKKDEDPDAKKKN